MRNGLVVRPRGSRLVAASVAVTLLGLPVERGWAQAAPPAAPGSTPPAEAAPAVPDDAKKAEAKAHFDKGLALLQDEAWAAALAEFLTSRDLYPTRAATKNSAFSLRKLQRYDESLDMYEALLRDFPDMPPEARAEAQRALAEMRELVGTIDIKGAEPGAAIVISAQNRGEYPPISPLRVAAGTHLVRVTKEGFEPFETRVDVAGGQTTAVRVKLRALTDSGRLKVIERSGRTLDVFVDNSPVGQTPWEGTLSVGPHAVWLRSKGRDGTHPAAAVVKSQQLATLTLNAEPLDSNLRVVPTPEGATVAIDGVPAANGIWYGPLKSGAHRIEVTSPGFLPVSREVKLERGGRENLTIKLERDPNAAMWRKPSRWTFDVDAGFSIVPSLGGTVAGDCTGTCSLSLGKGALGFFHAGYQLGSGVGFGLSAGYLFVAQSVTGRGSQLFPHAENNQPPPQSGVADDDLRLSAFLGGANVFYRLGDKVPVLFRLGGGVMVGQLRDERGGSYTTSQGNRYDVSRAVTLARATYLYVDPSVRVGVRLGDHLELAAGVQVLLLVALSQPTWDKAIELNAGPKSTASNLGTDGIGTYHADPMMGQLVIGVAPALSLRYDF